MLWSRYDDFICIAIPYSQHPRPPTLAEDRTCKAVESAMGHSLLNAGVTDNVHPVTDLIFPDHTSHRRKSALS